MTPKPLSPSKSKGLIETFRKHPTSLEVYEAKDLSVQALKELTRSSSVWLVREKNKWT